MPVTESVSSFDGFSDVYPSSEHELARLFDKCEFDKEGTHHHTISFKEAIKRLRTAVDNSLSAVEIITKRKVSEFRIGKTSVMLKEGNTFDPMKPTTWGKVGGANGKWRKHKDDNYDNLIAVGCVTNELIPQVIKETNTAIRADDQLYALEMVQALVQHYMVQEPDGRLRNKSFDIKNFTEGKIGDKGGIICVAYKLEPEIILKEDDLVIKKEEQEGATGTAFLDRNTSPSKQARATQQDQRLQGTSHEKNPEEAYVSKVESEKGPMEEKTRNVIKKMTKDEKMLILRSYISLSIKSDWDQLADNVYNGRIGALSREMIKHYEDIYKENKLKDRIKAYIYRVQKCQGNETDKEIIDLMKVARSNEPAASPQGSQNVNVNIVQK